MKRPLRDKAIQVSQQLLSDKTGATHFFCLPLYHSNSRTKLENIVRVLRQEGSLSDVPKRAFRLARSFHINVGSYRFENAAELKGAVDILRHLDQPALLELPNQSQGSEVSSKSMKTSSALSLSLRGLTGRIENPTETKYMRTTVENPSYPIRLLAGKIQERLASKGLDRIPLNGPQWNYPLEIPVSGPLLISTNKFKKKTFLSEAGEERTIYVATRIDAREILEKYQDFEWATDIKIEKLSLCKEGRIATFNGPKKEILLDEYYEEIASIPLPQDN